MSNIPFQTIICVPCYNESKRLDKEAFISAVNEHSDIAFLFVNDGSKDNTLDVLNELAEKHANLQVLNLEKNVGKAEAVRLGILQALQSPQSPHYVGFYDADMATPLTDLYEMVKQIKMNQLYLITGCRFKRMGGDIERRYSRFILGRIFATFAANVLKLPIYDTQCGTKVLDCRVAKEIFATPFVSKWIFDIELFARTIIKFGYQNALSKIIEFPLSAWKDVRGSKLQTKDMFRQPIDLLKIHNHYKLYKYAK